jgi:hypothetical protein
MSDEWLDCLPWDGMEKSIPAGYRSPVPRLNIRDFVVKPSIKRLGDAVIGFDIEESVFDDLVKIYGRGAIMFAEADGGRYLSRWGWKEKYGTDALRIKLMAILNRPSAEMMDVGGR